MFVFAVPLRHADGTVPPGVRIVPAPETTGLPVDYAAVLLDGVHVPHGAWLRDGASIDADGAFHDPAGLPPARLTRSMGVAPPVWRGVISASAAITRASAGMLAHWRTRRAAPPRPPRAPPPLTDYRNQQEAVLGALAAAYALTAVAAHVTAPRPDAPQAAAGAARTPRGRRGRPSTATWRC